MILDAIAKEGLIDQTDFVFLDTLHLVSCPFPSPPRVLAEPTLPPTTQAPSKSQWLGLGATPTCGLVLAAVSFLRR